MFTHFEPYGIMICHLKEPFDTYTMERYVIDDKETMDRYLVNLRLNPVRLYSKIETYEKLDPNGGFIKTRVITYEDDDVS